MSFDEPELPKKIISIFLTCNGCDECRTDTALFKRYLEQKEDYIICKEVKEADLIIILGCSVTQNMEDESREFIKILHSNKKPSAKVLVAGCLARIRSEFRGNHEEFPDFIKEINAIQDFKRDPRDLAENFPYNIHETYYHRLYGRARRSAIRDLFKQYACTDCQFINFGYIKVLYHFGIAAFYRALSRLYQKQLYTYGGNTYCIKLSTGCRGKCSYCSIKQARGGLKSKPLDCVMEEFYRGLKSGYEEFALLGTDIGDYGKDIDTDLLVLLEKMIGTSDNIRLRLRNVTPRWLIPNSLDLARLSKSGKIAFIQSPVQSGSNHVLEFMNRGYHAEGFIDAIRTLRASYPAIFVKTQIIVGFPGETDTDFQETVELVKLGLFDHVEIFLYSERPGTAAAKLPCRIPDPTIMKRRSSLIKTIFFQELKQLKTMSIIKI